MIIHNAFKRVAPNWKDYMRGKYGVDTFGCDCSWGCKYFVDNVADIGDWGVCINPKSPRAGMLTFEHMGCDHFRYSNQDWRDWPKSND